MLELNMLARLWHAFCYPDASMPLETSFVGSFFTRRTKKSYKEKKVPCCRRLEAFLRKS
jgi:hypothetical protein